MGGPGMPPPVIEAKKVSKTYSGICVLDKVDLSIYQGEVHTLVGENGAGKSTLIKIIAGEQQPDEGSELLFAGESIPYMTPTKSLQLGISVIYQDINMLPNLTIAENLFMGRQTGLLFDRQGIIREAKEAFRNVGLDINPRTRLGDLSLGQQQLVAIVKAVTANAKVVIMDEPTSSLAGNEVEFLYRLTGELKNKRIGVVYISHKLDEVFKLADRITVLRDGKNVACDRVDTFDTQSLVRLMVGRELRFIPMLNKHPSDDVLFEVRHLGNRLVDDISFAVRRNEILGVTGLVGAGRSEMAQTIFGIQRLERGEIYVHGEKVTIHSAQDAIKKGISYLSEDRFGEGMFRGQSVAWNATAAVIDALKDAYRCLDYERENEMVADNIKTLQIKPNRPQMHIESMSGGNQQKVMLGRWLNTKPKVLIIDEPTCGVDVGTKQEIYRHLRHLASRGMAIILISSDLPEVLSLSDRIVVMRQGRIVDTVNSSEATMEDILSKGLLGHRPIDESGRVPDEENHPRTGSGAGVFGP